MKYSALLALGLLVTISLASHASEVVDPTSHLHARVASEIANYKENITELRGETLIATADRITGSGLSDSGLYSEIENKINILFREHQAHPKNKTVPAELNALMRALASIDPKSVEIIDMLRRTNSRGLRNRAARLGSKVDWFAQRNELMQKPDFYKPDQELMTHRYLNLITSEDPAMRRWGAEEINRRGGAEPIVYQHMADILEKEKLATDDSVHVDQLAWFAKTLRRFDETNSADLLNKIANDGRTHPKLVKYAQKPRKKTR